MKELIAPEGFVYALKSDNTVYGKRISLSDIDSEDNWILIKETIEGEEVWHESTLKFR
jgi:hypothetical protein